ncbi:hypothetical protein [Leptospira stimsonii]|uniref:Uncharacterized protein n=1 Tax=Leptospira stimsonii TaxID=2202203 RepID=A0ABY2MVN2_9LEPT|nr:hypothetical protein [Leptospira stimsonii]TGK10926.1 hypothetical protein EHO98_20415 [Leptospira stimsonii]TGM09829.1 hypothetical protein EHQ90_20460 [Leptospira stimsonii]
MNQTTLRTYILTIFTFLLFYPIGAVFADKISSDSKPVMSAKEYLNSELDQVFPIIQKMKKEDAAVLITQIREESKKEWSNADKFYFLISHLEAIKAIEEEQERLKSLNEVYLIGSILLGGFLVFSIFRQRALIRKINSQLSEKE